MLEDTDKKWMEIALEQAIIAESRGEIPIGALVILQGEIKGLGFNQPIDACDPTAHAEIVALRQAAKSLNNYRLSGATLYVTIEPCTMCVGALLHARISRLVFGAREPRAGAVVSQQTLLRETYYNHRIEVVEGVLEKECGDLMQHFFRYRREQKKHGASGSLADSFSTVR